MKALLRLMIHLTFFPTMWVSWVMYKLGLWRQWDALDEHVLVGALPSKRDLAQLKAEGVGAVVNMCEEFTGHSTRLQAHGLDHLHLPTLDYFSPTEENLVRGMHFIDQQIADGKKVYLHCKAGRGRSATLALCYLMRRYDIPAKEAYVRLRAARPHVSRNLDFRIAVQNIETQLREGSLPLLEDVMSDEPRRPVRDRADRRGPGWTTRVVVWAVLGVATLMFHGCSVMDGLWFDDHWHQRQLRDLGWSFADLLETTRLAPDEIIDAWWQNRSIAFEYARPFAVSVQKCVYYASGGSVVAQHVMSLLLHVLAGALVFELCWQLTRRIGWSLLAGLVHIIYPLSVFAVSWLAAQNIVLQTVLMLAALLLYVRASRLRLSDAERQTATSTIPRVRVNAFAATLTCWVLALFSRENAVVFPVMMVALDAAFGGRQHVRARWKVYGVTLLILAAYLSWRFMAFGQDMPPVYVRRPDGMAWLAWSIAKLMHYLTSAVWPSPMSIGPAGRDNPLVETPLDIVIMAGILALVGGAYVRLTRGTRGWWLWPLWILLAVLPVVPVLATPHTGYLCGAAFAIGVVMMVGIGPRARLVTRGRWRRAIPFFVLLVSAVYFPVNWLSWRGMVLAERYTLVGVTMDTPPEPGTQLFFINLPFVNSYVGPCLTEEWGPVARESECHVLTYSPDLVRVDQLCVVEAIDRHTIEVSIVGAPYFSGLLGRFLIEAMRNDGPFQTGQTVTTDAFDVRILEAGASGVRRLSFTFEKPLDSEDYRFYLTTYEAGATRLHFSPPAASVYPVAHVPSDVTLDEVERAARELDAGSAVAARVLFIGVHAADDDVRRAAGDALLPIARAVAKATGSRVQLSVFGREPDAAEWNEIAAWWSSAVTDLTLRQAWTHRRMYLDLAYRRDEVKRLPTKVAPFARVDLYLTGPPRRGPR